MFWIVVLYIVFTWLSFLCCIISLFSPDWLLGLGLIVGCNRDIYVSCHTGWDLSLIIVNQCQQVEAPLFACAILWVVITLYQLIHASIATYFLQKKWSVQLSGWEKHTLHRSVDARTFTGPTFISLISVILTTGTCLLFVKQIVGFVHGEALVESEHYNMSVNLLGWGFRLAQGSCFLAMSSFSCLIGLIALLHCQHREYNIMYRAIKAPV